MISGILAVDKPQGWTSHDVVARVRRLAGQRQVGHAGTLDPLATGLLLLVLGQATRMSQYLMDAPKTYLTELGFGATTVTDDAEAPLLERRSVEGITREDIERILPQFIGELSQIPPAYAAVRHGGQKLYQLARSGIDVQPQPRTVIVHQIELIYWHPPCLRVSIRCGSGTYIRSIARDLGAALEVGGYLHALRRTHSGSFHEGDGHTMDELERLAADGTLLQAVEPSDRAVVDWPAAVVAAEQVAAVQSGMAVPLAPPRSGTIRLYGPSGALLALAMASGALAKPFRVLSNAL